MRLIPTKPRCAVLSFVGSHCELLRLMAATQLRQWSNSGSSRFFETTTWNGRSVGTE